ncbi:MAG: hypothetical protein H0V17_00370 [Deltaproteobacteria bacterium]|nr:hypothetical protein [Deltaproteobacteria bacterium]
MRGIGNRRQRVAIVACLAWVLGIVGLPALHLAHHDADLTHADTGAIVAHDSHRHGHDHVSVERDHDRDLEQLAIDHPIESGHQAGGVAHHAVALHQPVPPAIALVTACELQHAPPVLPIAVTAPAAQPAARGPPSNA